MQTNGSNSANARLPSSRQHKWSRIMIKVLNLDVIALQVRISASHRIQHHMEMKNVCIAVHTIRTLNETSNSTNEIKNGTGLDNNYHASRIRTINLIYSAQIKRLSKKRYCAIVIGHCHCRGRCSLSPISHLHRPKWRNHIKIQTHWQITSTNNYQFGWKSNCSRSVNLDMHYCN